MPRQDILIDAPYGEVETADDPTGRAWCDFRLLGRAEGGDDDAYAYG